MSDEFENRCEFYPHGHVVTDDGMYARAHQISSGAPYSVWKAPKMDWWTVLDRDGKNVLTSLEHPGQVFTGEESARLICESWNKNENTHR